MSRLDTFSPGSDLLTNHKTTSTTFKFLGDSLGTPRKMVEDNSTQGLRERANRVMSVEKQKNELIEDLLTRLETVEMLYQSTQLDLTRESHYNRDAQMRQNQFEDQLRRVKAIMDRDPFVLVLIDGDGMVFDDRYLQQGEKGGKEAASMLWATIRDHVAENLPHVSSPRIMARVYANVKGLGEACYRSGIIEHPCLMDDFMRGFNGSKMLFDFVDVGSGKDKADEKLSEMFRAHLYDCHCHQIFLGISHDNGYARLLEERLGDIQAIDHITVIEGVPFEKELANLQSAFKTTKFNTLFRDSKIAQNHQIWAVPQTPVMPSPVPQRASAIAGNLSTPTNPLSRVSSNTTTTSSSSNPAAIPNPLTSWAAKTAAPFVPSAQPGKSPVSPATVKEFPSTPGVDRNRLGQRIDQLDTTIPNEDIRRVKKLKLCNVHFLLGNCHNDRCTHDHNYKLSKHDKKCLEMVSKMTPCYYKTECDDPKCIYGHRCPQSVPDKKDCYYKDDCRFAGWGHGVDTRIVKTTKV